MTCHSIASVVGKNTTVHSSVPAIEFETQDIIFFNSTTALDRWPDKKEGGKRDTVGSEYLI